MAASHRFARAVGVSRISPRERSNRSFSHNQRSIQRELLNGAVFVAQILRQHENRIAALELSDGTNSADIAVIQADIAAVQIDVTAILVTLTEHLDEIRITRQALIDLNDAQPMSQTIPGGPPPPIP